MPFDCSSSCSLLFYYFCINVDPGLTLTYFTERSSIVKYAYCVYNKNNNKKFRSF